MSYASTNLEGDVSVVRNLTTGGNTTVRGSALINHDLRVEGWLDAPNIKGPLKGLYASLADLEEAYPCPRPGWFALVGDSLPADVYAARGGKWTATGEKGGTFALYPDRLEKDVSELRAESARRIEGASWTAQDTYGTVNLERADGTVTRVAIPGMTEGQAGLFTPNRLAAIESEIEEKSEAVKNEIAESRKISGYAHVRVDTEGRITDAIREDGTHEIHGQVEAKGLTLPGIKTRDQEGPANLLSVTTDSLGRVLSYVDRDGVHIPALVDDSPSRNELARLRVAGCWRKKGREWSGPAMFTIHDDDTMDSNIPSSGPSAWMTGGGYATTLFAVLKSLGLRGCLSMEGWKCGLTETPPELNENGKIVKMLQDRYGWEIQSHSMTARYQTNNWWVPSLDSELAAQILAEATTGTVRSNSTTSIFDAETGKQYSVKADKSGWEETPKEWIKPYVMDYTTKREKMYNPIFPIDYQWGDWFRAAGWLGIHGKAWVTSGNTSSHANVLLINAICPWGFESDGQTFYNLPPLGSTATRMMMEGQQLSGYAGEQDTDNSYKQEHYNFYKGQIDEASEKGAWIVMGLHAYRPCWVNRLPGALVSEGGAYPDAWVNPVSDPMNPSVPEGWHPCPGTRLYMLWELLKYARDKGMLNVTSSEGFERMGNQISVGYWDRGIALGPDKTGIEGTRTEYPHYVVGVNGAEDYYSEG